MITQEQISQLPTNPGVYLMMDAEETILYIGKAIDIQSRVRSHFAGGGSGGKSFYRLVESFDFLVTKNEVEALLLENALIKEKQPRYNARLKDDKRYPFLKLSLDEKFPRLYLTRTMPKKGEGKKTRTKESSRYFGPYPQVREARTVLQSLQEIFPLRTCRIPSGQLELDRPCLEFEMHRCLAPCVEELCGAQEYREVAERVERFLEGDHSAVATDLERRMMAASEDQAFEKAAIYRDALEALRTFKQRQAVSFIEEDSEDYLAVSRLGDVTCIGCLRRRGGSIRGSEHYFIEVETETSVPEILSAFIEQHYETAPAIPRRVLCSALPSSHEVLQKWLTGMVSKKISVKKPHRGSRMRILDLASKNAEFHAAERYRKLHGAKRRIAESVLRLGADLGLNPMPLRIEGFDISHHRGEEPVASMVVFENGASKKSGYRKFKIKTAQGGDDFRSMQEVIARRFAHMEPEFGTLPDLVLIDGGPVQLEFAMKALALASERVEEPFKSRLLEQPIISLAKREEEIFLPGNATPIRLKERHEGLKLLQRVRDESHRFAISFHRKRKGSKRQTSILESIPGVGPKRVEMLLERFGSLEGIGKAALEEIEAVPGVNGNLARKIADACRAHK